MFGKVVFILIHLFIEDLFIFNYLYVCMLVWSMCKYIQVPEEARGRESRSPGTGATGE